MSKCIHPAVKRVYSHLFISIFGDI